MSSVTFQVIVAPESVVVTLTLLITGGLSTGGGGGGGGEGIVRLTFSVLEEAVTTAVENGKKIAAMGINIPVKKIKTVNFIFFDATKIYLWQ